jgi:hypothetical protein
MEEDIVHYILTHYGTKPLLELTEEVNAKFGTNFREEHIRSRFRYHNKGGTMKKTQSNDRFRAFLAKARTEKEILTKFKDGKGLLAKKYEGSVLFTQRNIYHELVYILLPKPPTGIKLLPKKYEYHIGKDDKGEVQPYLLVKVPDFKGKLIIAPLFDIHYGHQTHNFEKFMGYVEWIRKTPNVFAILGGDIMENAIDDGRGMTYDQEHPPMTQLDRMTEILSTIAHKILVSVPGNHEQRTEKKTGIDVAQVLADRLKVPYFNGPVTMSIIANTYKWTFYIFHGYGNSQTKGGKMNIASRPKNWTGHVNFFVSGHTHDCLAESETMIVEDPINCRLMFVKQWTVVSSAFLGWVGSYAYKAGYKPPSQGGVSIELHEDGGYNAHLTD